MSVTDLDQLATALSREPRGESLPAPAAISADTYADWVVDHWQSLTPEARERERRRASEQRVGVAFSAG